MSIAPDPTQAETPPAALDADAQKRSRPKPGERKLQILQTLASMLEQPDSDRITTAALALRLSVSEAALYRHFASKAQMFESLIDFIEQSLFTLANQINESETDAGSKISRMVVMTLQFAEKNPGMARVMAGDALVFENERLATRMNQFYERFESMLRQSYKQLMDQRGSPQPTADAQALAGVAVCLIQGRLHRFTRTGFKRLPTEHVQTTVNVLLG